MVVSLDYPVIVVGAGPAFFFCSTACSSAQNIDHLLWAPPPSPPPPAPLDPPSLNPLSPTPPPYAPVTPLYPMSCFWTLGDSLPAKYLLFLFAHIRAFPDIIPGTCQHFLVIDPFSAVLSSREYISWHSLRVDTIV